MISDEATEAIVKALPTPRVRFSGDINASASNRQLLLHGPATPRPVIRGDLPGPVLRLRATANVLSELPVFRTQEVLVLRTLAQYVSLRTYLPGDCSESALGGRWLAYAPWSHARDRDTDVSACCVAVPVQSTGWAILPSTCT